MSQGKSTAGEWEGLKEWHSAVEECRDDIRVSAQCRSENEVG
jgi:hypothetical protein